MGRIFFHRGNGGQDSLEFFPSFSSTIRPLFYSVAILRILVKAAFGPSRLPSGRQADRRKVSLSVLGAGPAVAVSGLVLGRMVQSTQRSCPCGIHSADLLSPRDPLILWAPIAAWPWRSGDTDGHGCPHEALWLCGCAAASDLPQASPDYVTDHRQALWAVTVIVTRPLTARLTAGLSDTARALVSSLFIETALFTRAGAADRGSVSSLFSFPGRKQRCQPGRVGPWPPMVMTCVGEGEGSGVRLEIESSGKGLPM